MKKILFFSLLMFFHTTFAQVKVILSQIGTEVDEDFTITFTYLGKERHFVPDFSSLEKDFTIMSTAKSSHISVINGHVRSQTQWQVTLNASQPGTYDIPSIKFGNELSKPVQVSISSHRKAKPSDVDNNFFMEG